MPAPVCTANAPRATSAFGYAGVCAAHSAGFTLGVASKSRVQSRMITRNGNANVHPKRRLIPALIDCRDSIQSDPASQTARGPNRCIDQCALCATISLRDARESRQWNITSRLIASGEAALGDLASDKADGERCGKDR